MSKIWCYYWYFCIVLKILPNYRPYSIEHHWWVISTVFISHNYPNYSTSVVCFLLRNFCEIWSCGSIFTAIDNGSTLEVSQMQMKRQSFYLCSAVGSISITLNWTLAYIPNSSCFAPLAFNVSCEQSRTIHN